VVGGRIRGRRHGDGFALDPERCMMIAAYNVNGVIGSAP